jgi:hypothetical protein
VFFTLDATLSILLAVHAVQCRCVALGLSQ